MKNDMLRKTTASELLLNSNVSRVAMDITFSRLQYPRLVVSRSSWVL